LNTNKIKRSLLEGKPVWGTFIKTNEPHLVEIIGYSGFDFIIFDKEHGFLYKEETENLLRAAELSQLCTLVRIPDNNTNMVLRNLDIGIQGVHFSQIDTSEEAICAVKSCLYPPEGTRGLSFSNRPMKYGLGNKEEFLKESKENILVVVAIETKNAVKNLPEILKVEGIDIVFIGKADLSASYGVAGQKNHPLVNEACEQIIKQCKEAGKPFGAFVQNIEVAKKHLDKGFTYLIYGSDLNLFSAQCVQVSKKMKDLKKMSP